MEHVQRPWVRWLLTVGFFPAMVFGNLGIAAWFALTLGLLIHGEARAVIRERGRFGLRLMLLSWVEKKPKKKT